MKHQPRGPDAPEAVFVGSLMFVIPRPRETLSASHLADVACALVAEAGERPDLAGVIVEGLEERLGVNSAHREALIAGSDVVRRRIAETKRRRKALEAERARRLGAQLVAPRSTEAIEEKLARAAEHREKAKALEQSDRNAKTRQNRAKIKEHETAAKLLEIEAAKMRREDADDRWRFQAITETVQLAQARGEEVEHEEVEVGFVETDENGLPIRHKKGPKKGQKVYTYERVTRTVLASRGGGLETALEKGHLEGRGPKPWALYEIGDTYRQAFEIYEGKTSGAGEGAGGGFGPKGPQIRVAEAGETLAILREGLSARERRVLDLVCGEGLRLRQVAEAMKAGFPATQRALRGGLHAALDSWIAAKKDGRAGEAAARIQEVDRLVRRAKT